MVTYSLYSREKYNPRLNILTYKRYGLVENKR